MSLEADCSKFQRKGSTQKKGRHRKTVIHTVSKYITVWAIGTSAVDASMFLEGISN